MLDPQSAFGLAANIFALLQLTAQAITQAYGFVQSASDALPQNELLTQLASNNENLLVDIERFGFTQRPLSRQETNAQNAALLCAKEASLLLDELRKLKPTQHPGKFKTILSAMMKSVATSSKRQSLESKQKRLQALESQLAIALLELIRHDQSIKFNDQDLKFDDLKIWMESKQVDNATALLDCRNEIKHIADMQQKSIEQQRGLENWKKSMTDQQNDVVDEQRRLTSELQLQRKDLEDQSGLIQDGFSHAEVHYDESREVRSRKEFQKKVNRIRESLPFERMNDRRDDISEADRDTFEWCFNADASPLYDWLVRGSGIFWICGKAGSGKSTLMKYLYNDERTWQALRAWAKPGKMIFVNHFFWYAGTLLQRSHLGLLQSLLYLILSAEEADESVTSVLCADRFAQGGLAKPWTREELVTTIRSIRKCSKVSMCIFIDGLDEYTPQSEHDRLVAELLYLASVPNIKLCISSRPWTVFENLLGKLTKRITLEDHTRNDIAQYVRHHLEPGATFPNLEELVQLITTKAQGVFLWVSLVVSALKDRIEAGETSKELLKSVEAFPPELGDYFRESIYKRINGTWRSATAQALKMALLISQPKGGFIWDRYLGSFLPFWVLHQKDNDGNYKIAKDNFAMTMRTVFVTKKEIAEMVSATRKHINACCRDFLFVSQAHQVDFLHRTVYDFLSSSEMTQLLNDAIPTHWRSDLFLLNLATACMTIVDTEDSRPKDKIGFGLVETIISTLPVTPPVRGQRNYFRYVAVMKEVDRVLSDYAKTVCKGAYWMGSNPEELDSLTFLRRQLKEYDLHAFDYVLRNDFGPLTLGQVTQESALLPTPRSTVSRGSRSGSLPGAGETEWYQWLAHDQGNILNVINGSFEGFSRDNGEG